MQLPNLDLTTRAICAGPMFVEQRRRESRLEWSIGLVWAGLEDDKFDLGHAILFKG